MLATIKIKCYVMLRLATITVKCYGKVSNNNKILN